MTRQMKLVDIEATVSLAVDGDMTFTEIQKWIDDAISAKLDAERELEDWGGGIARVYPNGEACLEVHLTGAR